MKGWEEGMRAQDDQELERGDMEKRGLGEKMMIEVRRKDDYRG